MSPFRFPDELVGSVAGTRDLPRRALEAFALEELRAGHITEPQLCEMLGLARIQVDGFLKCGWSSPKLAVHAELSNSLAPLAVPRWIADSPEWLLAVAQTPAVTLSGGIHKSEAAAMALETAMQADLLARLPFFDVRGSPVARESMDSPTEGSALGCGIGCGFCFGRFGNGR